MPVRPNRHKRRRFSCRHNATEGCDRLKNHLLRWALYCVAATPVALLASKASASQKVTIGPGDSVDSLARKYHVATKDICHANGITKETILRDGRVLIIPDGAKTVSKPASMKREATV